MSDGVGLLPVGLGDAEIRAADAGSDGVARVATGVSASSVARQLADDYAIFIRSKRREPQEAGLMLDETPGWLYPFQVAVTQWALRKGRAAIWADTGLGKTRMQLAWAARIPGRVLILAPLCVAHQTADEGAAIGVAVGLHVGNGARIEITNYDRLHQVSPGDYAGVVLDESSILKSMDGKTRTKLIAAFAQTPYRLCCTATPAPNDIAELANHAEFLAVMTRQEMLATWFVHDDLGWRLKGHARTAFFRWLASWGLFLRHPSDLGFSDDGYRLPSLETVEHAVEDGRAAASLFPGLDTPGGLGGRLRARRGSVEARVAAAADLIRSSPGQWIVWCGLNTEQSAISQALGEEAISVAGADSEETKESRLLAFLRGEARVLITKSRIAGFGLNLQACHQMVFLGLNDSFEGYYQAVRRCWRFGQSRPVGVHLVVSKAELGVLHNVQRKARQHDALAEEMIAEMRDEERQQVGPAVRPIPPAGRVARGDRWELHEGDCVPAMAMMPPESADFSVYSPPFMGLYVYSASERDIGNASSQAQFLAHMRYVVQGLLRLTKPGRLTACHAAQVTSTKASHGVIGLFDLRGMLVRLFVEGDWIYHGDVTIDKDPQAQAIRTHSKALLFAQLRKDSSWLRPALADYILLFRKPGENVVPIRPEITNDQWIEWARPVWYGIRESDTLNVREARAERDERHVTPLQLGVVERCVRLWSNPGELVLSPFAGIGSEGYVAVRLRRRFIGIELKPEYWETAARNLKRAEQDQIAQPGLGW